jgi:hypothetical protein
MNSPEVAERHRAGLELQAGLPVPRHRPPRKRQFTAAGDVADSGCLLAELGVVGLILTGVAAIAWFCGRRRPSG